MDELSKKIFERNKFLTRRLEDKLDKMIGFFFWKTYVATTLYANISTPINLAITIFTALMTAHSSTSSSFISSEMNMQINLITFLISILNSYFTPQKQFNELNEYLMKWSELGNNFEKAIYTSNTYEKKIKTYTEILDKANELYKDQFLKKRNFLTDLLHGVIRTVFMDSNDRWMKSGTFDFYDKIQDMIELDFDLDSLKYENKKASLFEKLCSCFKCCFRYNKSSKENNNYDKQRNSITKLMNEFEAGTADLQSDKDDDKQDNNKQDDDKQDDDKQDDDKQDDDKQDNEKQDNEKQDNEKQDNEKQDDEKQDNEKINNAIDEEKRKLFESVISYNYNENKKKNINGTNITQKSVNKVNSIGPGTSLSASPRNNIKKEQKKAQVSSISDKVSKHKRFESANLDYLIETNKALLRSEAYMNGRDIPSGNQLINQNKHPESVILKDPKNIELTDIKIN